MDNKMKQKRTSNAEACDKLISLSIFVLFTLGLLMGLSEV